MLSSPPRDRTSHLLHESEALPRRQGRRWYRPRSRCAGECFGLLGPNGAGKTTTIEILEGVNTPDGGEVRILGMTWRENERDLRERIGVSLQETQLAEKLTVYETLRLFRSFYRKGRIPTTCCATCRSMRNATRASASSPVDRSSGWPWPARWSASRTSSSSTSRRPGSIRRAACSCGRSWPGTGGAAERCCSRRTTWKRRSGSATASPSSITASASLSARRRSSSPGSRRRTSSSS